MPTSCAPTCFSTPDGRVHVRNQAVGDHAGARASCFDPGSTGVSTLIPDESHRDQRAYQSVVVAVEAVVFDEQHPLSATRALVKVDVEGAEPRYCAACPGFCR